MSSPAISVENLTKAYRIGLKEEIPDTLMSAATGWLKAPFNNFHRLRRLNTFARATASSSTLTTDNSAFSAENCQLSTDKCQSEPDSDILWALKDVSFEVGEGEVVGIIGRNGAGKSTLLKILSRITEPTGGRVKIRGRVSSLLEVGTGFHPELSGRENIYMNGTILGMTKREIDGKFDEIVDFSGVERFLDTPIKRYSSGMTVRLAFAVAAHLDPEILMIDEVLAVGDIDFQKKCLGKMNDIAKGGRTVIFVSHNMTAVSQLCSHGLIIDNGRIDADDTIEAVVARYLNHGARQVSEENFRADSKKACQYVGFRILNTDGCPTNDFSCDEGITVEIDFEQRRRVDGLYFGLWVLTAEGMSVLYSDSTDANNGEMQKFANGRYRIRLQVPQRLLGPGSYYFRIDMAAPHGRIERRDSLCGFQVREYRTKREQRPGVLSTIIKWDVHQEGFLQEK